MKTLRRKEKQRGDSSWNCGAARPPTPPRCVGQGGGVLRLRWPWTVPQSTRVLTKRKKKLFSSLIYIIYLKRNVFTPAFSSEGGHLVLIPFIISISLVKSHCIVLLFIMGVSWGLCFPVLSPLLPQLSSEGFHCVYKTSANKLTFPALSRFLLLKFIALYIFLKPEPRQQNTWRELGEGQKRTT